MYQLKLKTVHLGSYQKWGKLKQVFAGILSISILPQSQEGRLQAFARNTSKVSADQHYYCMIQMWLWGLRKGRLGEEQKIKTHKAQLEPQPALSYAQVERVCSGEVFGSKS